MGKFFNIAGAVLPGEHYMLSTLERNALIGRKGL